MLDFNVEEEKDDAVPGEDMSMPKCPRCGSEEITPDKTDGCFNCNGKCLKNYPDQPKDYEHVWFQYDDTDGTYAWPAIGISYSCHKDDVDDIVQGKMSPVLE